MSLLVILLSAVLLVSVLFPKHVHHVFCIALLSPVMLYSLMYFVDWYQINFVWVGIYTCVGIIIGGVWFFTGAFLLSENPHEHIKRSLMGVNQTVRTSLIEIAFQFGLIACLELIWRVFLIAALTQFLPIWLCIVIAAVLFWLLHEESWPLSDRSVEIFQFSLALTMIYAYTGSLVLVWCAHMVRVILTMAASTPESTSTPTSVSEQNP